MDASKNNITVTVDQDKANIFSEYFASVFTNEALHDIPKLKYTTPENSLSNINLTTAKITKELDKLNVNKSCGPDNLHPRFLKNYLLSSMIHLKLYLIIHQAQV